MNVRARIRQLKPELFLDDEFWALTQAHPELPLFQGFLGLWCQADREGRFEWRPSVLKTQILPYWGGDFAPVLDALRAAGLVLMYEVGGRRYGAIRSFPRHQRPNSREPLSCIPEPLAHAQADDLRMHEHAQAPRASRLPTPDSRFPTPDPEPDPNPTPAPRGAPPAPANVVPLFTGVTPAGSPSTIERAQAVGDGSARVYTMPGAEPTESYLALASTAGVHRPQAVDTWAYWYGKGLPSGGVERLESWLVLSAKQHQEQRAKLPLARASPGAEPEIDWDWRQLDARHIAFAERHGLEEISRIAHAWYRSGAPRGLTRPQADKAFLEHLKQLAREQRRQSTN